MDIIVGHGRKRRVVESDSTHTVGQLLAGSGIEGYVFHADRPEPLDPASTLAEADLTSGSTVMVTTCRRVRISVGFNGDDKHDDFPPATALAAVIAWAVGPKGFDLPGPERPKHTLVPCGEKTPVDKTDHVGAFADADCGACFELVPTKKFEG